MLWYTWAHLDDVVSLFLAASCCLIGKEAKVKAIMMYDSIYIWPSTCLSVFVERRAPCTDPRVLDYASWKTMPGILVLQVSRDGMIEGSAGDALRGSRNKWLTVPANHLPFTVRVKLNEPCPLWEIVRFRLKVQGVHSFSVTLGEHNSDVIKVTCTGWRNGQLRVKLNVLNLPKKLIAEHA